MQRIKFPPREQRKFLKAVLEKVNCPSLRAFGQFGFDVSYSTMKNYYNDSRSLPKDLFFELCSFAKLKSADFNFEILLPHWGQSKGGKISKRKK